LLLLEKPEDFDAVELMVDAERVRDSGWLSLFLGGGILTT